MFSFFPFCSRCFASSAWAPRHPRERPDEDVVEGCRRRFAGQSERLQTHARVGDQVDDDGDDVDDGDDGGVTFPVDPGGTARWRNVGQPKGARIAAEASNSVPERQSPR